MLTHHNKGCCIPRKERIKQSTCFQFVCSLFELFINCSFTQETSPVSQTYSKLSTSPQMAAAGCIGSFTSTEPQSHSSPGSSIALPQLGPVAKVLTEPGWRRQLGWARSMNSASCCTLQSLKNSGNAWTPVLNRRKMRESRRNFNFKSMWTREFNRNKH